MIINQFLLMCQTVCDIFAGGSIGLVNVEKKMMENCFKKFFHNNFDEFLLIDTKKGKSLSC